MPISDEINPRKTLLFPDSFVSASVMVAKPSLDHPAVYTEAGGVSREIFENFGKFLKKIAKKRTMG